jgi:hypothetical protein
MDAIENSSASSSKSGQEGIEQHSTLAQLVACEQIATKQSWHILSLSLELRKEFRPWLLPGAANQPQHGKLGLYWVAIHLANIRIMRNNIRDMRRNSTLAALLTSTRQSIVTTLFLRPEKAWYLSELAASIGTRPSSLQREIDTMVHVGILEKRVDGRRAYIKANEDSPIFPELRGLVEKTSGIVPALRDVLADLTGLQIAFIYGSLARGEEAAQSDVDVMLLGSLSSMELSPRLRAVESAIGRQINPSVFSLPEFVEKLGQKNHFLHTVLRNQKIMLIGTENELESIARGAEDSHPPRKQAGTR